MTASRPWPTPQRLATDECVDWDGPLNVKGYGSAIRNGRRSNIHRLIYERDMGPVPEGLHLDHLCRNRACVNPRHMEPVTPRENVLRGIGLSAQAARQTHCIRGHELSGPNVWMYHGERRCKACRAIRNRVYRLRRKGRDPQWQS